MAQGAVTIQVISQSGLVTVYGVPGESDVDRAFLRTKPLDCGTAQVEKIYQSFSMEIEGDTSGITLSMQLMNRLKNKPTEPFVELGALDGDNLVFVDESLEAVSRFIVIDIEDSLLTDWTFTSFTINGDYEGDVEQKL